MLHGPLGGKFHQPALAVEEIAQLFHKAYRLLLQAVALLEHIHAAAGVYQLLLARKERVAFGTYFDFDVLLGGPGVDHIAAGACDGGLMVVGMYILLHRSDFTSLRSKMGARPASGEKRP